MSLEVDEDAKKNEDEEEVLDPSGIQNLPRSCIAAHLGFRAPGAIRVPLWGVMVHTPAASQSPA